MKSKRTLIFFVVLCIIAVTFQPVAGAEQKTKEDTTTNISVTQAKKLPYNI